MLSVVFCIYTWCESVRLSFAIALTFTVSSTEASCTVTHAGSHVQASVILTHPTTCWYRDRKTIVMKFQKVNTFI